MLDKKMLAHRQSSLDMITSEYSDVVKGDLQEEVWLSLYHCSENFPSSDVKIISFRKKAEPYTDVCASNVSCVICVNLFSYLLSFVTSHILLFYPTVNISLQLSDHSHVSNQGHNVDRN